MPEGWAGKHVAVPKLYPSEFRDNVVRVARNREPGGTIEQIAKDFGVHPMTLQRWLQRSKIESGSASGVTLKDDAELGHRLLADEAAEAEEVMAERTASSNGWFSACGKPTRGKGRRPGPPGHDDLCAVIAEDVPDPARVRR